MTQMMVVMLLILLILLLIRKKGGVDNTGGEPVFVPGSGLCLIILPIWFHFIYTET